MVGRHLQEILPEAVYISSTDYNLTSEADVKNLCQNDWDHIIHLAARVGGILDNINYPAEFIEENLLMSVLLLKYARLNKVPKLTAILSTCIYPDVYEQYPLTEADLHKGEPQATNFPYAIAKRALAVQIDAYKRQYDSNYNYLIPCNLYGLYDKVDEQRSHYLTALIGKIIKAQRDGNKQINLLGTGKPLRQFMYAGDLAKVIKYCVDNNLYESFNVAPDENRSIREIAEIAIKVCDAENLEIVFDETSPDGQYRKDVSNAKLKSFIKNFNFTPINEGIKKVYSYYKTHKIV